MTPCLWHDPNLTRNTLRVFYREKPLRGRREEGISRLDRKSGKRSYLTSCLPKLICAFSLRPRLFKPFVLRSWEWRPEESRKSHDHRDSSWFSSVTCPEESSELSLLKEKEEEEKNLGKISRLHSVLCRTLGPYKTGCYYGWYSLSITQNWHPGNRPETPTHETGRRDGSRTEVGPDLVFSRDVQKKVLPHYQL